MRRIVQIGWHRYAPYGACYLAWGVLSAGGLWSLIRLREMVVALYFLAGVAAKLIPVLDRFGLVLLGLVWIAGIGALETFLRSGLGAGRLGRRIVQIAAIEGGFLGLSYALERIL
jgi:hypothetical protein